MGSKLEVGKGNGAYVPPADAVDIAALYIQSAQGDPLTSVSLHRIPVGRPKDFFRTVPDLSYRQRVEMYRHRPDNGDEEYFLIGPDLREQIPEAYPCLLVTVVDRFGSPRLWPIRQPGEDGKDNVCWQTARNAARVGLDFWVRAVFVNLGRGYEDRRAEEGYAPDPDFSGLQPFDKLVEIGFNGGRIIRGRSHPIYRALFGLGTSAADDDADPLL
jgi:hypothetical protein